MKLSQVATRLDHLIGVTNKIYANSVIDVTLCGDFIMAHELGHNRYYGCLVARLPRHSIDFWYDYHEAVDASKETIAQAQALVQQDLEALLEAKEALASSV